MRRLIERKLLKRLRIRKGDIFVCEGGDVGRTAILEEDINKEEFSYFWILRKYGVENPENISKKVHEIISSKEHWIFNESEERELRKDLYKVLQKELYKLQLSDVVKLVDELLEIDKIMRSEEL